MSEKISKFLSKVKGKIDFFPKMAKNYQKLKLILFGSKSIWNGLKLISKPKY